MSDHMATMNALVDACAHRGEAVVERAWRCDLSRGDVAPDQATKLQCYRCVSGYLGTAPEIRSPGLMAKITSFVGAVAAHVAAGLPQAPPEAQAERLAICQGCPFFADGGCLACGCQAWGLSEKIAWADGTCPLEEPKWGPVDRASKN